MSTFVVASDGSDSAQNAVDYCLELLSPEQHDIVAVYVAQKFPEEIEAVYLGGDTDLIELEQDVLEKAKDVLNQHVSDLRAAGFEVEVVTRLGTSGQEICKLARGRKAHGIIMGRQGRNAMTEALIGGTSHYVLHHAPCPVILVPDENEE